MTTPFCSWALLDRATGVITGSPNRDTALTTTQSMIKSWVVADFLRSNNPTAAQLSLARAAIVDSDDLATESLYRCGGGDAMIARLISMCGLTETVATPGWWSMTCMSARDACRMGLALLDGRAAGPQWTEWLLAQMRAVRGSCDDHDQHETTGGGRWGIIDGLPSPAGVAIKNGWTRMADGHWDINCLALHDKWVLAILMGYPSDLPLRVGASLARTLTASLTLPQPTLPASSPLGLACQRFSCLHFLGRVGLPACPALSCLRRAFLSASRFLVCVALSCLRCALLSVSRFPAYVVLCCLCRALLPASRFAVCVVLCCLRRASVCVALCCLRCAFPACAAWSRFNLPQPSGRAC